MRSRRREVCSCGRRRFRFRPDPGSVFFPVIFATYYLSFIMGSFYLSVRHAVMYFK
jgi:hypothetical protein